MIPSPGVLRSPGYSSPQDAQVPRVPRSPGYSGPQDAPVPKVLHSLECSSPGCSGPQGAQVLRFSSPWGALVPAEGGCRDWGCC